MKLTKTIQRPIEVIDTSRLRLNELYTIVNIYEGTYLSSELISFNEAEVQFQNGLTITAEEIADGEYTFSPVETYLDRWVATFTAENSKNYSIFFVAYNRQDAYATFNDIIKKNPSLGTVNLKSFINLSSFMDQNGYMQHGTILQDEKI